VSRLSKLSRSVAGRVVLVTGAASGMGRATARLFADEGALVAAADRDDGGVAQQVKEIEAAGGRALALAVDVAVPNAVSSAVAQVVEHFGGLDVLVNNAGISALAEIDAANYGEAFDRVLAVNLKAHTLLIRACLPHLRKSDAPRIINIASTEALGATARNSPYAAAKHGVAGLTRALAVELGREGITVNAVCPGPINTSMTAAIPDDAKIRFARRRVPLRRYGEPEEVAHMTLSLALPAASYVNGAVIPVDGGLTVQNT